MFYKGAVEVRGVTEEFVHREVMGVQGIGWGMFKVRRRHMGEVILIIVSECPRYDLGTLADLIYGGCRAHKRGLFGTSSAAWDDLGLEFSLFWRTKAHVFHVFYSFLFQRNEL